MADCKPIATPIKTRAPTGSQEPTYKLWYQQVVGSLMYLMLGTHPDMAFAVGYLGRFCAALTVAHWKFAKRVLRYVQGCINRGIILGTKNGLTGYSDADWAGDKEDRKSTSGSVFLLHGRAISWASKKQTSVVLSMIKAEYIALLNASKDAC